MLVLRSLGLPRGLRAGRGVAFALRTSLRRLAARRSSFAHRSLAPRLQGWWEQGSVVFALAYLFLNPRFHPAYGMTWRRKIALAWRMVQTTRAVNTATSYKAHLAMAVKLLETPPEVEGVVVECGCFAGGSTANLSLVCRIVGRKLIAYDSFEGLPEAKPGDRYAVEGWPGGLAQDVETVRENVRRHGALEVCEFRKGWFEQPFPPTPSPSSSPSSTWTTRPVSTIASGISGPT